MNNKKVIIEIFCAPNCNRCGRTVDLVQEIINELNHDAIQWRKINIVNEIDYAVSLGIRSTPSIIINGNLIFVAPPDKKALKNKILASIPVAL